jgi:integrase
MLIKSIIDNRRANRFGKYPVKILLSDKGNRKYISIGIYADLIEFDEASGLLIISNKKTVRENMQQNNLILAALTQVNDLVIEYRKENKQITPDTIIKGYKELSLCEEKELHTFNSYFRKSIESRTGRTKEIYQNTLNKIEEYFPETLYFENIDKSWLKMFIQKMKKEKVKRKNVIRAGLSLNTQSIHLRNVRAVFNEAVDDKAASFDAYPFRKFNIETEEIKHRAITVEELRKIFNYSGTVSENWARDVAKLIFFLIGINAVDLYKLDEIKNGYTGYRRSKTGRIYSVKLEPEAIEFMEKFKGKKHLLCFQEQFADVNTFLKKINGQTVYNKKGEKKILKKGLNTIGGTLGIPDLTSYVLRHTWATIAAGLDIPKETISKALGHGKKSVTDIYIDFDQTKIDEANRKVMDYILNNNT